MEFAENKAMLGVIALLLLLFAVAIFFYNQTLNDLAAGSCTDAAANCPHEKIVETQNVVIGVMILVIVGIVAWMFLQTKKRPAAEQKGGQPEAKAKPKKIDVSSLEPEEKKVVALLQEKGGSAFQSDIIKALGASKVKVSRILDRLEHKGLVERKRRGMANLVVLR